MTVVDDRALATRGSATSFLDGFEVLSLDVRIEDRNLERQYLRRGGPGPSVILMHEVPVVSDRTMRLANLIAGRGFAVAVPVLIGTPVEHPDGRALRSAFKTVCTAREFEALAKGRTGSIVEWLRALVNREYDPDRSPTVGVIGMCFSGGFALATAVDPHVGAAVISQPGLPFPIWFDRLPDLGLADEDLKHIKDRVKDGQCLRAMRYSADVKSPVARFDRLICEFPGMEHVQIPTRDPRLHSVLGDAIDADRTSTSQRDIDLLAALDGTLAFLQRELRWTPPPTDIGANA